MIDSYVFKLKYSSKDKQEVTRRYGFTGDLRQEAVFEGLYDRTSQVFGLPPSSFYLVFHDSFNRAFRLSNYKAFVDEVCEPTLNPDTLKDCKRDEKGRIVLVFIVRREEPADSSSSASGAETQVNNEEITSKPEEVSPLSSAPSTLASASVPVESTPATTAWEAEIVAALGPNASSPSVAPPAAAPASIPNFDFHQQPSFARPQPPVIPPPPRSSQHGGHHHHHSRSAAGTTSSSHGHVHSHGHHGHRPSPYPAYYPWTQVPPAPPQLPLSALPQQAAQAQQIPIPPPSSTSLRHDLTTAIQQLPATISPLAVSASGIDSTSLGSAKTRVEEVEKRCREFQERKRLMVRNTFDRFGPNAASSSSARHSTGRMNAYSPLYAIPPPPPAMSFDIPQPVLVEKDVKQEESSTSAVEATSVEGGKKDTAAVWTGVKGLLKTFVKDLNRHLADQLGEFNEFGFEFREGAAQAQEDEEKKVNGSEEIVKKEVEVERVTHPSVFCDRCVRTIKGPRYKCTHCVNFDLCDDDKCFSSRDKFHAKHHKFGVIARPGDLMVLLDEEKPAASASKGKEREEPVAAVKDARVEHNATCDLCDKTIFGVRHKCLACPDYDVCSTCYLSVGHLHPNHAFVPIASPTVLPLLSTTDRLIHPGVTCDGGCNKPFLVGPRYKCAHPSCLDFDMCENCEADPVPRHDPTHVLIKIRKPVARELLGQAINKAKFESGTYAVNGEIGGRREVVVDMDLKGDKNVLKETMENLWKSIQNAGNEGVEETIERIKKSFVPSAVSPVEEEQVEVQEKKVEEEVEDEKLEVEQVAIQAVSVVVSESQVAEIEAQIDAEATQAYEVEEVEEAEIKHEEVVEVEEHVDVLAATFVADVTLADRSLVPAGALFRKVWQVRNSGSLDWPTGTHLVNVGGFSKTSHYEVQAYPVVAAKAGEVIELECELKAPEDDGRHMDHWRLATEEGEMFGDRFWIDITVESDDEELRKSGSSLSASIVAPSINANGKTGPSTVSTAADAEHALSEAGSDFESIAPVEEDEESDSDSSDEDDSTDDSDSDGSLVVVSDEDEDSDEEDWTAATQ